MVMVAALKGPMTYGSTHFSRFSVYKIRPLKPQIWPLNSQIRPFTPQIRAPGPQIKLKIRSFGVWTKQGQIHGYPSCVQVGRGSDEGHQGIWVGAVRFKCPKTPKK